jgi:outer membrane protein TolC
LPTKNGGLKIVTRNLWKYLRTCPAILLVVVLLPCFSSAQTNNPPPRVLTLEDALDYALQHYPAVRASLEQVSATRAGIPLARAQYLPFLNGVYQDSRATQNQVPGIWLPTVITPTVEGPISASSGQTYWGSQAAAFFSWEPFDFGLRPSVVGLARSAVDKANSSLVVTRLQVVTAVGNYFLTALATHQAVIAAQANVDRWQVFNKSVHVLVDNQLRPGADSSRADAELSRAKTQLYLAQQGEQVALDTLAALMGAAGNEIGVDTGPLLGPPPAGSLPEAPPSGHPLARDQMAAVREVQAQEKVLQHTDYPRFFLQAEGFGRGSEVPNNGTIIGNGNGLAPGRGNWVAGLTILFPDVFDFKALSAKKQIAQANERAQQAHYQQTLQDLTGQIQAARDQLKTARLVAQETPTELSAARQTEIQSRARYEAGLATLVEVADAENLLAQAEMEDAIGRLNLWRGLFNVAYAQGDLEPFLDVLRANAGRKP